MKVGRLLFLGFVMALIVTWVFNFDFGIAFAVGVGLVVVITFGRHFFKELNRSKSRNLALFSVPLTKELSPAITLAADSAPVIVGTEDYSRRVVWEERFLENWLIFAERVQSKEIETVYYMTDLVIDPALEGEEKAVAFTVGGYILGYIPRVESPAIFDFLVQHGGIARCNAELKLNLKTNEFEAKYSVSYPLQIVEGL